MGFMNIEDIKNGKQLRQFRESLDLSQQDFSHLVGYSMNRISFIEINNSKITKRMKRELKKNWKKI